MTKKYKERWKRMVKGKEIKTLLRSINFKEMEIRIAVEAYAAPECKNCQERHCLSCDFMREICR